MKTARTRLLLPVVWTGATLLVGAHAAPPPLDAGSLLKQNEQGNKSPIPALRPPSPPATQALAPVAPEHAVLVRNFKFAGNTLLRDDVLAKAVAPYIERSLSMTQLREVADVVKKTYRDAGWTVRVYLPKQEVEAGVVILQVVEAVFGGASLSGAAPQRFDASRLIEMAETSLGKGQPLHALQLDRTLLLLDDLPGVIVSGDLMQGTREGETNLALRTTDEALVMGHVVVDNQGARTSGVNRLSVYLSVNSPAKRGDALGIHALKTQGIEYQKVGYSLPVGYGGWRAGVHASHLNYTITADEFEALNPFGKATTKGLNLAYPIVRGQFANINLALSYDDKVFNNNSNGASTQYEMHVFNAALNANRFDSWAGGGVSTASVSVTRGDKTAEARFSKLNINLSRLQKLSDSLTAYVSASSQIANQNLDSSEKIYLGGATGVRAYPSSEAGGSEGNTLTVELRQRIDNSMTLMGFYDYGRVKENRVNNMASNAQPHDYSLQGYGVSVAWQATQAVNFKATVSQRVGRNPAANSMTGMDSDGSKKVTRLWLSTGITF